MTLIRCPECKKDISDKSKHCIHCGFPISELMINNKNDSNVIDDDIIKQHCPICNKNNWTVAKSKDSIVCEHCGYIHVYDYSKYNSDKSRNYSVECPKCGSTNIQIVQRKFSLLTGFATNKVDRVCVNCKHKF